MGWSDKQTSPFPTESMGVQILHPPLVKAKTLPLTGVIVVGQEAGRKSFHLNEFQL